MLSVHFVYFALHKIFYPIGKRCNSTFCVTTSAMVCTNGTAVQNTVHRGLILWKVSINDKDNYKSHERTPPTWSYLSEITFLLEFTVMKELVYLCMQYKSLLLKKFLWRGYTQINEHTLLEDHVLHHVITMSKKVWSQCIVIGWCGPHSYSVQNFPSWQQDASTSSHPLSRVNIINSWYYAMLHCSKFCILAMLKLMLNIYHNYAQIMIP